MARQLLLCYLMCELVFKKNIYGFKKSMIIVVFKQL